MNTSQRLLGGLLVCAAAAASADSIYVCPGSHGQHVYTQQPTSAHCRPADIHGNFATYSAPAMPSPRDSAPAAAEQAPAAAVNANASAIAAAKKALAASEQALAEGKAVRLGNERNYAKYQARIQALEADVAAKKAALNALQKSNP